MIDPSRPADSSPWYGRSGSGGLPCSLIRILGLREGLFKVQKSSPFCLLPFPSPLSPILRTAVLFFLQAFKEANLQRRSTFFLPSVPRT